MAYNNLGERVGVWNATDWARQSGETGNPYSFYDALQNRLGGYLPPFDTGRGPSFGGGYGTWSGQAGQSFGAGNLGWNPDADLTDHQIESRIYDALDDDPMVPDTADIDIAVKDHVVTLSGTVRNKNLKRHLGDLAWAAPGIRDVNNEIRLKSRRSQANLSGQTQKETRPSSKSAGPARTGAGKAGSSGSS